LFGAGFFGLFCSCWALVTHTTARLQIKTRNILIRLFFMDCWTLGDVYLFNVPELLSGCLRWHKTQTLAFSPRLLSVLLAPLEQHVCNSSRKVQASCFTHRDAETSTDVARR